MGLSNRKKLEQVILGELFLDYDNRHLHSLSSKDFKDKEHKFIYNNLLCEFPTCRVDTLHLRVIMDREKMVRAQEREKYMFACSGLAVSIANLPNHISELKLFNRNERIYEILEASGAEFPINVIKELHDLTMEHSESSIERASLKDLCIGLADVIEERQEKFKNGVPYPTGLPTLDEYIGGIPDSGILVIGGRTSMGKTALMTNFACCIASKGHRTVYFSCEMNCREIGDRIISYRSGVENYKLRYGKLTDIDLESIQKYLGKDNFYTIPLHVCYTPKLSPDDVKNIILELKPKIIFVDHIQLMKGGRETDAQSINDNMYEFKRISGELKVGIVIGSQISRDSIKTKSNTTLSPAFYKGSGGIEESADICCEIKQKGTEKKEDSIWNINLEVNKNRHGRVGTIPLKFYRKTLTFKED